MKEEEVSYYETDEPGESEPEPGRCRGIEWQNRGTKHEGIHYKKYESDYETYEVYGQGANTFTGRLKNQRGYCPTKGGEECEKYSYVLHKLLTCVPICYNILMGNYHVGARQARYLIVRFITGNLVLMGGEV